MKASITFREDRQPVVRAKVPISVLGLPFLSGVSAGGDDDARALSLDLATAFECGPSVRLSYRPNDSANPLSLVLKSGAGTLGSPLRAPFSISAEFNLLSAGSRGSLASFSLLFKPRLGDFAIKKTVRSSTSVSAAAAPSTVHEAAADGCTDEQRLANGSEMQNVEFRSDDGKRLNGFLMDINAAGTGGVGKRLNGLVPGFEVTARSILPLRRCATVTFRWGMRAPTELMNEFERSFSLKQLPLLVMNKISIEHVADVRSVKEKKVDVTKPNVTDAYGTVTLQLEKLQAEYDMLRKVTEELRSEVSNWNFNSPRPERLIVTKDVKKVPDSMAEKRHSREGSPEDSTRRTQPEEVKEELKKAMITSPFNQRV